MTGSPALACSGALLDSLTCSPQHSRRLLGTHHRGRHSSKSTATPAHAKSTIASMPQAPRSASRHRVVGCGEQFLRLTIGYAAGTVFITAMRGLPRFRCVVVDFGYSQPW